MTISSTSQVIMLRSDPALSVWLTNLIVEESEPLLYSYSFTLAIGVAEVGAYVSLTYWSCFDLDEHGDPEPVSDWLLQQFPYDEYSKDFPDLDLVRLLSVAADQNPALRVLAATLVADEVKLIASYLVELEYSTIQASYEAVVGVEWGSARLERPGLSLDGLQAITAEIASLRLPIADQ